MTDAPLQAVRPTSGSAYRPDIDGLRAVAILLVVVNHFFHQILPGGFVGVDIFFVISGYLITGIIHGEVAQRRFHLRHFYARRVLRLFPALASMLATLLVVGLMVLSPEELSLLGTHVAASAAFVINFILVGEHGYFDLASGLKPLLHMWSLGVEEQFYLVWPLILLVAVRFRVAPIALSAVFLISLYLNLSRIDREAVAVFFLPQFRAWEFAAGGLLALSTVSSKWPEAFRSRWLAEASVVLGLGLICASAFLLDARDLYPGWRAIPPVLGAVLLLAAGNRSRLAEGVLSNPGSLYLGRISYPLYLWHWPVIALLTILGGPPSQTTSLLALPMAVLLAMATYHLVEARARHLPWIVAGRDVRVPVLLAVVALIALAGLGLARSGGLPWRVAGYQPQSAAEYVYVDPSCAELAGEQFNYCRLSDAANPPTIALLGDSHANHFFEGVAAYAARFDETVINLGGCLPMPDTAIYQEGTVDGCVALGNAQLDYALNADQIHTIVMAGRMAYWTLGTGVNGLEAGRTRYVMKREVSGRAIYGLEAFETGLRALVAKVAARGKQLVLILDNPELDFPPASCLSQRPLSIFQRQDCSSAREMVEQRQGPYRAAVARVLADHPSVATFDPLSTLCTADRCLGMVGGELLYRDDNHLSTAGSLFLADHYNFLAKVDEK